jgi:CheY-like chemotaxis protein
MSDYVLIVEDDDSIARSLALLLDDYGFESKVVCNGREALAFLHLASVPTLILLDLIMPVMSGEEFIDIRTSDPVLSKIPICILTGSDRALPDREDIAARLRKPVDSKSVISIVERHCQPMA